ncbi:uncharacterized protein DUF4329 [Litoreibacter ponti]|uniref:Uncharacterized protein DUF4329 n=1 Tax=Litoreibacter ponti TaxID=1510457 RepID=A0A2T6BHP7_9RHOB|nr:DUF4329 domain-containing protein [Litoreibacter ponti]PTX55566.1 uncharacterized protein DUF4329 [Litoreibacter ponti]
MLRVIALCLLSVAPAAADTAALAQDRTLQATARQLLTGLQARSFKTGREFCGLIGRTAQGQLVATKSYRGGLDGCTPRNFRDESIEPIASFHTHAAYDPDADSEVPSFNDLVADTDEGVVGFVSTPGGRFWVTIPEQDRVVQICGLRCLPQDRDFVAGEWGPIAKSYTRRQLKQRELLY